MPLAAQYPAPAGEYYGVLLANGATLPAFSRATGAAAQASNIGRSAPAWRWATSGAGLTVLPASVDLGAASGSANSIWLGLY